MTLVQTALRDGIARLTTAGVPGASRDARLLMAAALGIEPGQVTLRTGSPLTAAEQAAFDALIAERAHRRPVAQILGRRAFWGREFEVTGDVLDPRPETEILVTCALEGPEPSRVLDLGTGSGAILVTLLCEWPGARGTGTDMSAAALAVAARNAVRHKVADRASFEIADWTRGITERYDLVVCNPPYIAAALVEGLAPEVRDWEPRAALTSGPTGVEAYQAIAAGLGSVLAGNGRALLEFGQGQGREVQEIFQGAGFRDLELHMDFDGRERVLSLRRGPVIFACQDQ